MRTFSHVLAGLAGLDLGLALMLLYRYLHLLLFDGRREYLGQATFVFTYGVVANFLLIARFLGEPERPRAAYVLTVILVILILGGISMADVAYWLRRGSDD